MMHPIKDRSAKLLIIEPNQSKRHMLTEGMRQLEFTQVRGANSIKDALAFLEVEDAPDWILTSLMAHEPSNAIQLLKIALEHKKLHKTRITFLIRPEEETLLPNAFEFGLFSYQYMENDISTLHKDIHELNEIMSQYHWNDCLTSAHYLRNYLRKTGQIEDAIQLDQNLIAVLPDPVHAQLNLAENYLLVKDPSLSLKVLNLIDSQNPVVTKKVEQLKEKLNSEQSSDELATKEHNIKQEFSIEDCLVIDSDEAVHNLARKALLDLHTKNVTTCSSGDLAWKHIEDGARPNLIIMEWRLPKLSSINLIQRIRQHGLVDVPIIIYSSLVKSRDMIVLREASITDVIEKPQTLKNFKNLLYATLHEEFSPKSLKSLERQVFQALKAKKLQKAQDLFSKLKKLPNVPPLTVMRLDAALNYEKEEYKKASELAIKALSIGGEDVLTLNLLGKIYMKLKQFKQAALFYERAQKLSPSNIERLCELAEAHLASDDIEKATETITTAKKQDSGNTAVTETEAILSITTGDTETAHNLLNQLSSSSNVAGFLNNKAVMFIENDKLEEAINLYSKALEALPKDDDLTKAIISYNLGLALARADRKEEALTSLKAVAGDQVSSHGLKAKANSLEQKLNQAIKDDTSVALTTFEERKLDNLSKQDQQDENNDTWKPQLPVVDYSPGSLRCFQLYQSRDGLNVQFKKMIANGPKYVEREALHMDVKKTA